MSDENAEFTPEPIPEAPPRRSPIRRAGCIVALVIWFVILLLPCFLIVLAVQQEIVITTGSAPGQELRLWLISEADERGLGLSSASVYQSSANALCVETNVHFLLWTGHSDPVLYCDCYQRASASAEWAQTDSTAGECTTG